MHNVESRGVRYSLLAAGFVASLCALLGSSVLNFRYGHALARTPEDGLIFGVLAVASDVFMAVSLFFYFEAKKRRQYAQMAAAIVVWAATTAFAGVAAISQASMNRIDAVAHRAAASTAYSDTRTELQEARKARGFIPQHRAEASVRAEVSKAKIDRLWTVTNECTDPTGKAGRTYCASIETLNVELGYAMQASKLDRRIEELVTKSDTAIANNASVTSEADPAAASIAGATGYSQRGVQTFIIGGFAVLILTICALGPYITSSMLQGYHKPDKREAVTIEGETIIAPAPPEAIKVEAPKQLALPKPVEPVALKPEPSPEWRALLDAVDFPRKKPGLREPKRPQDAREFVLGLRFLVWLAAHGRSGEFTAQEIEKMHDEYTAADGREPWGVNIAKSELRTMGKRWITVRDSRSPTMWSIEQPKLAHVRDLLLKRQKAFEQSGSWKGLGGNAEAAPAEKEATAASVLPFPSAVCGDADPASDKQAAAPTKVPRGFAELSRHIPDLRAMGALERVQKAQWQARMIVPNRKSLNRMSRVRAA